MRHKHSLTKGEAPAPALPTCARARAPHSSPPSICCAWDEHGRTLPLPPCFSGAHHAGPAGSHTCQQVLHTRIGACMCAESGSTRSRPQLWASGAPLVGQQPLAQLYSTQDAWTHLRGQQASQASDARVHTTTCVLVRACVSACTWASFACAYFKYLRQVRYLRMHAIVQVCMRVRAPTRTHVQ